MNLNHAAGGRYVRDIAYRSRFVPLQAPLLLSYVASEAGFLPPDPGQPFRYLELGCSSGATLNALAAACPQGRFMGIDFNADNIAAARQAAGAAGLDNVTYLEAAFSSVDPARIQPVDYVACTGTWSWLDDGEKAALINLLKRCLREGGLLFLSYVTLGRAAVTPMWRALRSLVPDSGQGSVERVGQGIRMLAELRDSGAKYLQQNPPALELLNEVHGQYLAGDTVALDNLSHNILADGFRDQLLVEVAAELAPAGMEFCGAAAPYLNDAGLSVPRGLQARFEALPGAMARAMFQDLLGATLIRTDVFVRNGRPDPQAARDYFAGHVRAGLVADVADIRQQLRQPGWTTFDFTPPAFAHVLDRLAEGASSIGELKDRAAYPDADIEDAYRKLIATPGVELCMQVPRPAGKLPERIGPACTFNGLALEAARSGASPIQLAASGLGSCIALTLPGSLLVAELCQQGTRTPVESAHARLRAHVAAMPGLDPAAVRQFADPQFFAGLHAMVIGRMLPVLLRFGALTGM